VIRPLVCKELQLMGYFMEHPRENSFPGSRLRASALVAR